MPKISGFSPENLVVIPGASRSLSPCSRALKGAHGGCSEGGKHAGYVAASQMGYDAIVMTCSFFVGMIPREMKKANNSDPVISYFMLAMEHNGTMHLHHTSAGGVDSDSKL